jgi:hypothetical protein
VFTWTSNRLQTHARIGGGSLDAARHLRVASALD